MLLEKNLKTNNINSLEDYLYESEEEPILKKRVITEKTLKTEDILKQIGKQRRKELNELLLH